MNIEVKDPIVAEVIQDFANRSTVGVNKYGVTLERTDLSLEDWLTHAEQEAMDFVLYLRRIKKEIKNLQ
jgi:hypothetical protein